LHNFKNFVQFSAAFSNMLK